MKRLTAYVAAALCCGLLVVPTALAREGASKTNLPTITAKQATGYAKKSTIQYYERLKPEHHASGGGPNQDEEYEITFAFNKLSSCKRKVKPGILLFWCRQSLTRTIRISRNGAPTGEEIDKNAYGLTEVFIEEAHPLSPSDKSAGNLFVFPLTPGWKVYVQVI